MSIKLDRRKLIATMGSAFALALLTKRQLWDTLSERLFLGKVTGANFKRGHHLLKKDLPFANPSNLLEENILDVAIVGCGVAGLSCAYSLAKDQKFTNAKIKLFELEDHLGGKSHSFKGQAPWGAHYLPLPNKDNKELLELLRELKILGPQFKNKNNKEGYNPYMVLGVPRERLFIHGRYQEGIVPQDGLAKEELYELEKFFKWTKELSLEKDTHGRYAFSIPMEESSRENRYREWDKISMAELLRRKGFNSKALFWYVNYCCRDDYGTEIEEISAWAGLHYFCSRRPYLCGNTEDTVLTWPEGNNYLIQEMSKRIPFPKEKAFMLTHIDGNTLHFYDFTHRRPVLFKAKKIVLALPQFIIARILDAKSSFTYSPWMVANITVKWDEHLSSQLAWDNVNYSGKGLGFIVAKHQSLESRPDENILTYYWPLTHLDPQKARKWAIARTHNQWCQDILADLGPMFFDLKDRIKSIDIWPWGHAMIRPTVNFIFEERIKTIPKNKNIYFAHSDLSGLSLFEEAFFRGTKVAHAIINQEQA